MKFHIDHLTKMVDGFYKCRSTFHLESAIPLFNANASLQPSGRGGSDRVGWICLVSPGVGATAA